jgi:hypothetical protein
MPITEPEGKFIVHCIGCGTPDNLCMIPHRGDGDMVGWIFACSDCAPTLYGTDLVFQPKRPGGEKWNQVMQALESLYEHYYEAGGVVGQGVTTELGSLMLAYDNWLD